MNLIESLTWDQLREQVRSFEVPHDDHGLPRRVYWRGQRDPSWDLVSAFDRMASERLAAAKDREVEAEKLRALRDRIRLEFKERIIGVADIRQSELQAQPQYTWAIGRHFGLLTPLLDWSESPYIALFFAIRALIEKKRSPSGDVPLSGKDGVALFRLVDAPGVAEQGLNFERARIDGLPRLIAQKGFSRSWRATSSTFAWRSTSAPEGGMARSQSSFSRVGLNFATLSMTCRQAVSTTGRCFRTRKGLRWQPISWWKRSQRLSEHAGV